MKKFTGSIQLYRLFDIGGEVDLEGAVGLLASRFSEKFKLRRSSRAVVIDQAPLVLGLGGWQQSIGEELYDVSVTGKLWSFGALSITLRLDINDSCTGQRALEIGHFLENDERLSETIENMASEIMRDLTPILTSPKLWDQFEDYLIYIYKGKSDPDHPTLISELLASELYYQLILGEPGRPVHEQMKIPIRQNTLQYGNDDIVTVDWNSAFIWSEGDFDDIADVLEFALVQLLELRYYDDLLSRKLTFLYRAIKTTAPGIFNKRYTTLSHEAATLYLEMSEIVERIENALKVVGDFYYAKVFRAAVERFRLKDWERSVDQKLGNMLEISKLFQSEITLKQGHLMEIIIIILIAIEVVPFLAKFLDFLR